MGSLNLRCPHGWPLPVRSICAGVTGWTGTYVRCVLGYRCGNGVPAGPMGPPRLRSLGPSYGALPGLAATLMCPNTKICQRVKSGSGRQDPASL